jgi:hypothetical protein
LAVAVAEAIVVQVAVEAQDVAAEILGAVAVVVAAADVAATGKIY